MRMLYVTKTKIVCGDCAGNEAVPHTTFLTKDGCCDACGGRSFTLAANLELSRRIAHALQPTNPTIS
jgi:hypothetical protein